MVVLVLFLITRMACVCATVSTHLLEALEFRVTFSEILCSIRCLDLAVPLQVLLCVLLILSLGHRLNKYLLSVSCQWRTRWPLKSEMMPPGRGDVIQQTCN